MAWALGKVRLMSPHADPAGPPRPGWPWVIAVSALCFLPFGLAAAYFAWRTDQALAAGDEMAARGSARAARVWTITAAVTGVVLNALILGTFVLLGAFGR